MPLFQVLERARGLGFLGPGPIGDHVDHAEQVQALIEVRFGADPDLDALDLGSGGGLPGLVLAHRHQRTRWCLLDANLRRTEYLAWAVEQLELGDRVTVLRARAELAATDSTWQEHFGLVTARSFAPPAVTAECAVPFMAPDGLLMVSEPPERDTARWPQAGLEALNLVLEEQASWAVLRRVGPVPVHLPRREGLAAKRPLW